MARRSPTMVNQTCDTGCTWRMFGIFNFREANFSRRFLSSTDATGTGSSRRSSDVLSKVDDKYPQVGVGSDQTKVSSRRRRDYGCKSMSCVKNVHIAADHRNKVTIDQKFVNTNYQAKEGVGCQPEQLLDALQILYSNKELFLNLLQDPNSMLVKQIHDLHSSQAIDSYQAMDKRHNARQCGKSSDRYDSNPTFEPQFSNKIVVLKPCTDNAKNFADDRFNSPWPNAQNVKPSHFPIGRVKRKLRYVMKVRRKEQQWRKKLEIGERDSPTNGGASVERRLNSSLDLKDSELCLGNEVTSFGENCIRITNNGSMSPFEENTFNLHVEGRKSQSDMSNHGIEEFKAKSHRRLEPLSVFESSSTFQRDYNHSSNDEGLTYCDRYEMDYITKFGLQKEVENDSYSSLSQEKKDSPRSTINTSCDKFQPFGGNLHSDYDTPTDDRYKDSPTRVFEENGIESFQDSHQEIQSLSFSQEDSINMINKFEHPILETVIGSLTQENVIDSPLSIFQLEELPPVQVMHEKFEEKKDMLREIMQIFTLKWDELVMMCELSNDLCDPSTFDELKGSINQLSCDAILLDCVTETFMDVYKKCCFPLHIARKNPNLEAHIAKKVLVNEIDEVIKLHFLPHPSQITLEQLVGKDLSGNGSWLNIQVDTEDIAMQVEEHVLDNLVLEIVSEMDIKA